MGTVSDLFEKHKLVRRLIVVWAGVLITYVVVSITEKITTVDGHAVAFSSAVIGLLATAIAFYKWHRSKEDASSSDTDPSDR